MKVSESHKPYTGSHRIEGTSRSEDTGAEDCMKALNILFNGKTVSVEFSCRMKFSGSHKPFTGSHRIDGTSISEDTGAEQRTHSLVSSMARTKMKVSGSHKPYTGSHRVEGTSNPEDSGAE
ncbi:hypothetical protein WA026_004268 [Henosepilachna vigintioctopunctata]|uniref:Uncharacterized protein n=1 Tax=Henosepilachna vigintioctopunctata TaxID=420089 RepID=A0AAW1V786_9CUCU